MIDGEGCGVAGFSLVDEAWIPVLDAEGRRRDVSLLDLFARAGELRMIACELPTQTFAILRLALAVLHRVTGGPPGSAAWLELWQLRALPVDDIAGYLGEFRDRFDLLHPEQPFYQVADLHAGLGRGIPAQTPAEAARWLVHRQAYDPSGIKTRKGRHMGVASVGALGGVHLEGDNLRETLLLNLIPVAPGWQIADERDLPVWERPPQSIAEEPDATRGPFGLLSLYTWQSRRIRLFGDRDGITGATISNGDALDWQDRHQLEPLSLWSRSAPREKAQKRTPVYLPRPHDHTRALWRGLQTLLPPPPPSNEPPQRLSPLVSRWLARLTVTGALPPDLRVRHHATSVTYGTRQAVVDEVFGDSLTMNVLLVVEGSALRTTAVAAAADTEAAVTELRRLATNLVRAAGGDAGSGAADRAAESAYTLLDRAFRDWLAALGPESDPRDERTTWQRRVRRAVARVGSQLVETAGPAARAGRSITGRAGTPVHYSSSQAEAWFRSRLAKALPLADDETDQATEASR